jgi:flagellar biosynthetic protein FliR
MSFEELVQLDPKIWPLAVMMFLRIATIFFLFPIFGENTVPRQLRIALALVLAICLWPAVQTEIRAAGGTLQWSPLALLIATFREVTYGFAVAFAARVLLHAVSIAAQLVGVNMGFQTATLFSNFTGHQESAFSVLQGWVAVMLILGLNVHHMFLEGLADSFRAVPIAPIAGSQEIARVATTIVTSSFILGLKLAAPLLVIQILLNAALGCLTRAVPQLNVFVLSFPISFLVGMIVLFFGAGMYVRYMAHQGMGVEAASFEHMQKVFRDNRSGGGGTP